MAIKFKGTETSGLQPTGLGERELAWNLADKTIYSVTSGGGIVEFLGIDTVYDDTAIQALVSTNTSDITSLQNNKENSLGNPATDGQILSSTASGTRSWVDAGVISLSTIDGNLIPTYIDTNRTKTLSVEISTPMFTKSSVSNNAWISIGNASDADTGYVMPYNGTLVGLTGFTEASKDCDVALYNNGVLSTAILFQFTGTGNQSVTDNTLNIDFAKGDKLRLRGTNISGFGGLGDTNIELRIKWRA